MMLYATFQGPAVKPGLIFTPLLAVGESKPEGSRLRQRWVSSERGNKHGMKREG